MREELYRECSTTKYSYSSARVVLVLVDSKDQFSGCNRLIHLHLQVANNGDKASKIVASRILGADLAGIIMDPILAFFPLGITRDNNIGEVRIDCPIMYDYFKIHLPEM